MNPSNLGNMNGYYQKLYSAEDLQTMTDLSNPDAMMGLMMGNGLDTSAMVGGQTLDDIISMNNKDLQRRRSYHQSQPYGLNRGGIDPRRSSMMEFGSGNNGDLAGFQFDPSPNHPPSGAQHPGNITQRRLDNQQARRRESVEDLALNTHFQNMGPVYSPLTSSSPYQHHTLHHSTSMPLDMSGDYMSNMMEMDYSAGGLNHRNSDEVMPMNMYTHAAYTPIMSTSPMQQNLTSSIRGAIQDPGGGMDASPSEHDMMEKLPDLQTPDQVQNFQTNIAQNSIVQQPIAMHNAPQAIRTSSMESFPEINEQKQPQPSANLDVSAPNTAPIPQGENVQNQIGAPVVPQYRNAYSASGFDMLGVLMRVASRPKALINIGAVDMSCAFAVCDVTQHDIPIVYCSDVFERLTGYTKHEILGRNCRFLQAPDGKIQAGVKRKYVDDRSVLRIKKMINQRQEMQISIINYRKGGQPFMNLLTMIPITWDSEEIKYYVGFQVDLVEQPTSITNKNPGWPLSQSITYNVVLC